MVFYPGQSHATVHSQGVKDLSVFLCSLWDYNEQGIHTVKVEHFNQSYLLPVSPLSIT